ncbi:MAG: DUF6088 family protein [Bacillota bacterium]|nr:DUF6088 family protein [Bacillota bacterium]
MERKIVINKIKNRIRLSEKGTIFLIADFLDIGSYDAVRKALSRLVNEEILFRVIRGIYKKSNYNEFLQYEIPASPDALARAIARSNNWTIGPKGDAALNILGLTTQVPTVYHYISDGPSKKIKYDNIQIVFDKRTNKVISGYSYKTILVIEAIRTLGPENMNELTRKKILNKCNKNDLMLLNSDGKNSTRWIYEEIKKILDMGEFDYVELS